MGVVPQLVFLQVMDTRRNLAWEQDGCVPVRARSAEDGGGAPGPPPLKVRNKSEVK